MTTWRDELAVALGPGAPSFDAQRQRASQSTVGASQEGSTPWVTASDLATAAKKLAAALEHGGTDKRPDAITVAPGEPAIADSCVVATAPLVEGSRGHFWSIPRSFAPTTWTTTVSTSVSSATAAWVS